MSKKTTPARHERRISASQLRRFIASVSEDITDGLDKVLVSLSGNTFEIHLEGGTINITMNMEGGAS